MNISSEAAKGTLCKNILIYGYCKYENKGCAFSHRKDNNGSAGSTAGSQKSAGANLAADKRKFNVNTPSFQPATAPVLTLSKKFAGLLPKVKDIPVFVPSATGPGTQTGSQPATGDFGNDALGTTEPLPSSVAPALALPERRFNTSTPSFTPQSTSAPPQTNPTLPTNPYMMNSATQPTDMYYQSAYPLQYHLYAPTPPPRLAPSHLPHQTDAQALFIDPKLREALQKRNEATLQTYPGGPEVVDVYHSVVPIAAVATSKVWKVPAAVYKGVSNVDGNVYALRKVEGVKVVNETPFRTIKRWHSLKCANIVRLHDAFTTLAFGTSALVVAYDFYPTASTLLEQHVIRRLAGRLEPLTEDLLWLYLAQLVNAMRTVHSKKLALRSSLDMSKIIVTSPGRIRLAGVGMSDILNWEDDDNEIALIGLPKHMENLQAQDIASLASIMVELATVMVPATRNDAGKWRGGLSADLAAAIDDLGHVRNLELYCKKHLAMRLLDMMEMLQNLNDYTEGQLATELENARLVRLMTKLNFIVDRPEWYSEAAGAAGWLENGPKYLVKLFRDYLFFQTDERGQPVTDLSRVLVNLNKLDAGIDEKFLLVSRDEKTCIVVSYKEVRDLVESVFRSLSRAK